MNAPLNHSREEQARALGRQAIVLTVREAADQLKTSEWTIHKLVRERQLASIKIGARRLIPLADLEAFIQARRTPVIEGGRRG